MTRKLSTAVVMTVLAGGGWAAAQTGTPPERTTPAPAPKGALPSGEHSMPGGEHSMVGGGSIWRAT